MEVVLSEAELQSIDAYLDQHFHPLPLPDCGDEYRMPPYLTASGDLSHHLDPTSLPPIFPTIEVRRPAKKQPATAAAGPRVSASPLDLEQRHDGWLGVCVGACVAILLAASVGQRACQERHCMGGAGGLLSGRAKGKTHRRLGWASQQRRKGGREGVTWIIISLHE